MRLVPDPRGVWLMPEPLVDTVAPASVVVDVDDVDAVAVLPLVVRRPAAGNARL